MYRLNSIAFATVCGGSSPRDSCRLSPTVMGGVRVPSDCHIPVAHHPPGMPVVSSEARAPPPVYA